jgi:hypothetical protein
MSEQSRPTRCAFFGCTKTDGLHDLTPLDVPEGGEIQACATHYEAVLSGLLEDGRVMEKPAEDDHYRLEEDDEEDEGSGDDSPVPTKQNLEAIIGPQAKFSDHRPGEVIRFRQAGQEKQGTILHVRAPGAVVVGGQEHGVIYAVDTGEGFPEMVRPGDVIE